jgi:CRISPR/Cas system CSM-associated protein Csm4 (group 5 of RAMP superfamily)
MVVKKYGYVCVFISCSAHCRKKKKLAFIAEGSIFKKKILCFEFCTQEM